MPQGQSGQVWKISPPPGFDHRTVQPIASRYTDYATWPKVHLVLVYKRKTVKKVLLLMSEGLCLYLYNITIISVIPY